MSRVVAWIAGLLIAALGFFVVIEGVLPPKSFPIIIAGICVVLLGGYVLPNTAVADGSKRLLVVAQPYLPLVIGSRRATDPPAAPPTAPPTAPVPPKDTL